MTARRARRQRLLRHRPAGDRAEPDVGRLGRSQGQGSGWERRNVTGRPPHVVTLVSIEDDARDERLRVVWELERGAVAHDQHALPGSG